MKEKKISRIFLVIVLLSMGGLLLFAGCTQTNTAPSNYTLSVPADSTYEVPKGAVNYRVNFRDNIVGIKDSSGVPKQGIKVKFLFQGSGFDSFYTDLNFNTTLRDPYEAETDSTGKILVNYRSAAFTSISTDQTFKFGFRAQSGGLETSHNDTVTVKGLK